MEAGLSIQAVDKGKYDDELVKVIENDELLDVFYSHIILNNSLQLGKIAERGNPAFASLLIRNERLVDMFYTYSILSGHDGRDNREERKICRGAAIQSDHGGILVMHHVAR